MRHAVVGVEAAGRRAPVLVPRGVGRAVGVHDAGPAVGAGVPAVAAEAQAQRCRARSGRPVAQHEAAVPRRGGARQGVMARALERHSATGHRRTQRAAHDRDPSGVDVDAAPAADEPAGHADRLGRAGRAGVGRRGGAAGRTGCRGAVGDADPGVARALRADAEAKAPVGARRRRGHRAPVPAARAILEHKPAPGRCGGRPAADHERLPVAECSVGDGHRERGIGLRRRARGRPCGSDHGHRQGAGSREHGRSARVELRPHDEVDLLVFVEQRLRG